MLQAACIGMSGVQNLLKLMIRVTKLELYLVMAANVKTIIQELEFNMTLKTEQCRSIKMDFARVLLSLM